MLDSICVALQKMLRQNIHPDVVSNLGDDEPMPRSHVEAITNFFKSSINLEVQPYIWQKQLDRNAGFLGTQKC